MALIDDNVLYVKAVEETTNVAVRQEKQRPSGVIKRVLLSNADPT